MIEKISKYTFGLLSTFFLAQVCFAEYSMSEKEILQLPKLCRNLSIGNFRADAKKYHIPGGHLPGQHTQHYCHGLKAMVRRAYGTAVKEFTYVQKHSNNKNRMLPSVSLVKAESLRKLGHTGDALKEYLRAIKLKRKYPRAYMKLAGFYMDLGENKSALDTVKKGLRYSPRSKGLKRRLKTLKKRLKQI